MSDYLTRAVESIRPEPAAIRPRLPTVFEPEGATPASTFVSAAPRDAVERLDESEAPSPLRERIISITESVTTPQPTAPITSPIAAARSPAPVQRSIELPSQIVRDKAPAIPVASLIARLQPEVAQTPTGPPPPTPAPVTILPRIAPRLVTREQSKTEPPTVHVTIGRIEVRAIAPAPTPSPQAKPPRAPRVSLDDYLRQRNGSAT